MKERNMLYFLTAVMISTLFVLSIIVRFLNWYNMYGTFVMPKIYMFIIPLLLVWVAWYFENKGFFLSSSIVMTILFYMHTANAGILSGTPYVISSLAPIVKTIYVSNLILIVFIVLFGFFTYIWDELKKN